MFVFNVKHALARAWFCLYPIVRFFSSYQRRKRCLHARILLLCRIMGLTATMPMLRRSLLLEQGDEDLRRSAAGTSSLHASVLYAQLAPTLHRRCAHTSPLISQDNTSVERYCEGSANGKNDIWLSQLVPCLPTPRRDPRLVQPTGSDLAGAKGRPQGHHPPPQVEGGATTWALSFIS